MIDEGEELDSQSLHGVMWLHDNDNSESDKEDDEDGYVDEGDNDDHDGNHEDDSKQYIQNWLASSS